MTLGPARELVAAFGFLTRLPVWWMIGRADPPPLGRAVWAYPLVGAAVGAIGGGVAVGALALGVTPLLAAALALGAMILATGALHEDGLADTADGFGGGATRDRKLEIMRDSRLGTYGAVALILSVLIRCAALAALAEPRLILLGLMVSGAVSRGFLAPLLQWLPSARSDGLGAAAARPGIVRCLVALLLAVAAAAVLRDPLVAGLVLAAAALAVLGVAWLAVRQVGGQTGDVMATAQQAADCAILVALVVLNARGMVAA